jgi:hypothetical protein
MLNYYSHFTELQESGNHYPDKMYKQHHSKQHHVQFLLQYP